MRVTRRVLVSLFSASFVLPAIRGYTTPDDSMPGLGVFLTALLAGGIYRMTALANVFFLWGWMHLAMPRAWELDLLKAFGAVAVVLALTPLYLVGPGRMHVGYVAWAGSITGMAVCL